MKYQQHAWLADERNTIKYYLRQHFNTNWMQRRDHPFLQYDSKESKIEERSEREKIESSLFFVACKSGWGLSLLASQFRVVTLFCMCFNSYSIIFDNFIIISLDRKSWKGTGDLPDCPSIEDAEWSCSEKQTNKRTNKEQLVANIFHVRVSYVVASKVVNVNIENCV